jgi:hypothetical protein
MPVPGGHAPEAHKLRTLIRCIRQILLHHPLAAGIVHIAQKCLLLLDIADFAVNRPVNLTDVFGYIAY